MSDGWALTLFLVAVVAVICAIFAAILLVRLHIDKTACTNFGEESHREVKFVRYTAITWDCLTPTRDGHWISTHNLREF